jgi:hypothetical protein
MVIRPCPLVRTYTLRQTPCSLADFRTASCCDSNDDDPLFVLLINVEKRTQNVERRPQNCMLGTFVNLGLFAFLV